MICDNCKEEICGNFTKCLICHGYVLCEKCEKCHDNHPLKKYNSIYDVDDKSLFNMEWIADEKRKIERKKMVIEREKKKKEKEISEKKIIYFEIKMFRMPSPNCYLVMNIKENKKTEGPMSYNEANFKKIQLEKKYENEPEFLRLIE